MSVSDPEVDRVGEGAGSTPADRVTLGHKEVTVSPETLASLEKMTNITQSCARQLRAINEAMER